MRALGSSEYFHCIGIRVSTVTEGACWPGLQRDGSNDGVRVVETSREMLRTSI